MLRSYISIAENIGALPFSGIRAELNNFVEITPRLSRS
jgi:hypothetical protein